MEDVIIIVIIAIVVGFAGLYVYRKKKAGSKCIGCPYAGECGKSAKNDSSCTCGSSDEKTDS